MMNFTTRLDELESIYRNLLSYYAKGITDDQRKEILQYISRGILTTADEIIYGTERQHSGKEYYQQLRLRTGIKDESLGMLITRLQSASDRKIFDSIIHDIFNAVWVNKSLSEEEKQQIVSLSVTEDDYLLCTLASALTLALEEWWDVTKMELLLSLLTSTGLSARLKARLWTGVVLTAQRYPIQIEDESKRLTPILHTAMETQTNAVHQIQSVVVRLYAALETDEVNRKVQTEVIEGLRHISPNISNDIEHWNESTQDNSTKPDWFRALEGSGLDKTLRELSEMQERGADVMYSTFKGLKHNLFFHELPNWFLPFDMQHSAVAPLLTEKEFTDIIGLIGKQLCNVDAYALLATLSLMPENMRMQALRQMSTANLDELKEQLEMNETLSEAKAYLHELKHYLEDLYRFHKDYRYHSEFYDSFNHPYLTDNSFLSQALQDIDFRKLLADMLLKQNRPKDAADLLQELCNTKSDDAALAERLGWAWQSVGQYEKALQAYTHADLIEGSTYWVTRQQAECKHRLNRYADALADYERCIGMKPGNNSLLLRAAACHLSQQNWKEALQYYYRYELTVKEGLQTARPIAWCLLMSGETQKSESYYTRILSGDETELRAPDYLNAGHAAMIAGNKPLALFRYRKALSHYIASDNGLQDKSFYRNWASDTPILMQLGVTSQDILLMSEAIREDINLD